MPRVSRSPPPRRLPRPLHRQLPRPFSLWPHVPPWRLPGRRVQSPPASRRLPSPRTPLQPPHPSRFEDESPLDRLAGESRPMVLLKPRRRRPECEKSPSEYCKKNMKMGSVKSMDELCAPIVKKVEDKMLWVPEDESVTPEIVCKTTDGLKKDDPEHAADAAGIEEARKASKKLTRLILLREPLLARMPSAWYQGAVESAKKELAGKAKLLGGQMRDESKAALGKEGKKITSHVESARGWSKGKGKGPKGGGSYGPAWGVKRTIGYKCKGKALRQHGPTFQNVTDKPKGMEPLPGAKAFMTWPTPIVPRTFMIRDSFQEFALPVFQKLGHPMAGLDVCYFPFDNQQLATQLPIVVQAAQVRKGKGQGEGCGKGKGRGKGRGKGKPVTHEVLDKQLEEYMGPQAVKATLDAELDNYFKSGDNGEVIDVPAAEGASKTTNGETAATETA